MGFGGAGELIVALIEGLVHPPGVAGQCRPTHLLGAGEAVSVVASCKTFVRTLSVIRAVPVSTSRMPSRPTDIVMLAPAPTSM